MRLTAKQNKGTHLKECEIIENDSYVDDIMSSVDEEEEAAKLTTGIDFVLEKGGFFIKRWITSAKTAEPMSSFDICDVTKSTSEKVLGVFWSPSEDVFRFKAKINFSEKNRNVHTEADLDIEDLQKRFPVLLTSRMVLSQVAKIFDPLGFLTPFTLKAKLLLRKSGSGGVNHSWNEPLNTDLYLEWKEFFISLFDVAYLQHRDLVCFRIFYIK